MVQSLENFYILLNFHPDFNVSLEILLLRYENLDKPPQFPISSISIYDDIVAISFVISMLRRRLTLSAFAFKVAFPAKTLYAG